MSLADTAKLVVNLSLGGNFQSGISKATRDLKKFDSAVNHSASRSFQAGQQIGNGVRNIAKLSIVAATGIGAIVAASVHAAGDFEAQLNTINTIAHKTAPELGKIGEGIRGIAKDTGTSLDDLTTAYYDLLSAGIKTADAQNVLTQANKLAIGGLGTTAETVDLLTTAINAYGGDASKAAQYTDDFAKAIEIGKVTASEIASSFANVGSIAANAGIKVREIAAAYGYLTSQGVPAAEVTTQMSRSVIELLKPGKALAGLQSKLGKNYADLARKKGLVPALQQLRVDAAKAKIPFIDLFGRVEAYKFALQTTGEKNAGFNEVMREMGKDAGTAAAQMAERQKGLNFQLAILKANAKDAGISIGSALLPKLTPLLATLNKFVSGAEGQKAIADFGTALAGLFTNENIAAGANALKEGFQIAKDAAPAIAGAAKITGAALKVAVDAFNALPPEIKTLAIAGLAINKLTGGLVTNVFGAIAGAIAKSIISAPLVNVSGGVVNVGGAGGVGGVAATGLSAIQKVFLVGEAIGLALVVKQVADNVSAASTAQATAIQTQTQAFIANNPKPQELQTALAGVNQGIHDLEFNPLNVLVQGEALDKLRQMRASIQAALIASHPQGQGPVVNPQGPKGSGFAGPVLITPSKLQDSFDRAVVPIAKHTDIDALRNKVTGELMNTGNKAKAAGDTAASAARAAGYAVAGAINAKDLSIQQAIKIDVNVSAAGVTKSVVIQNRAGPGNGSAGSAPQSNLHGAR